MIPDIAVVDFGSQHTLEILRTLRELGHLADLFTHQEFAKLKHGEHYRLVIGSGGYYSVYQDGAPMLPDWMLPKVGNQPCYFGICYGMQVSMHQIGGRVVAGRPEYSKTMVTFKPSPLFDGIEGAQQVWMSHGDELVEVPDDVDVIGVSDAGVIVAVAHKTLPHFGVQLHPEVVDTPCGKAMVANILRIAGCERNYTGVSLPNIARAKIREHAAGRRAIVGFSAGVDSSTLAALAKQELGDDLLAVLVDAGHLREGEIDEIKSIAAELGLTLKVVDIKADMYAKMKGATDEQVRDIFAAGYSGGFRMAALEFDDGRGVVIFQGTIAPDRIESGKTGGAVIKKHHNLSVDFGNISESGPLGDLFKDEVRELAKIVGLPKRVYTRMPFPGPGTFLRGVRDDESAEVVRWADARVREICAADPEYADINQLYACNMGRAPGVKGDTPVYGYIIGVRGVRTTRYMTVEGVKFSPEMQTKIDKILTEGHRLIVFTAFIPTNKPPGMVEMM